MSIDHCERRGAILLAALLLAWAVPAQARLVHPGLGDGPVISTCQTSTQPLILAGQETDPLAQAPGGLIIHGNFYQGASGVLRLKANQDGYGRVVVDGTATIEGSVILQIDGFMPPAGYTADLITTGGGLSMNADFRVIGLSPEVQWVTVTSSQTFSFTVIPEPSGLMLATGGLLMLRRRKGDEESRCGKMAV